MDIGTAIEEAQEHFDNPPPNEAATCEWVILPFLYAMGYGKRDVLAKSLDNGGKFPDYTVLPNDTKNLFYLEAKAWKLGLEDRHATQALNYANQNGKRWVVLTNGRTWRLYDNKIQGLANEKLVTEIALNDKEGALRLFAAIGKESVCSDRLGQFAADETDRRRRLAEELLSQQESLHRQDASNWKRESQQEQISHRPENVKPLTQSNQQGNTVAPFEQTVKDVLLNAGSFEILSSDSNVFFLPQSWAKVIPENGTCPRKLKRDVGVVCNFRWRSGRITMKFSVTRMKDEKLRLDCVKALERAGFELGPGAFTEKDWCQFYNTKQDVSDPTDRDKVRETVKKILAEAKDKFSRAEAVLTSVFQ